MASHFRLNSKLTEPNPSSPMSHRCRFFAAGSFSKSNSTEQVAVTSPVRRICLSLENIVVSSLMLSILPDSVPFTPLLLNTSRLNLIGPYFVTANNSTGPKVTVSPSAHCNVTGSSAGTTSIISGWITPANSYLMIASDGGSVVTTVRTPSRSSTLSAVNTKASPS